MIIDKKELRRFLAKAKVNTYTSSIEGTILKDGSKELVFSEEKFLYRDRYFGENPFIGEEIVFYQGEFVWSMNYYGYVIPKEGLSINDVYAFLREALKKASEKNPLRGPDCYERQSFKYVNRQKGDLDCFSGREKILYEQKQVYTLHYHGGLIKK